MVLIDRIKAILLLPGPTWKVIEGEFAKPAQLWVGYILPLAAIGPVARTIGNLAFGKPVLGTGLTNRISLTAAIQQGLIEYVLALVSVFALGQVIALLSPNFGGQKNTVQGLKVAAYASTAHWVGGVFALLPALNLICLLFSLYSLYLLYVGAPIVMKPAKDQAMPFTVVSALAGLVIFLIGKAILQAF